MGRDSITSSEFERLYLATVRDVLGYVGRRTSGEADDLVAEVYAVAWRRRKDLPPPMLRRAWLFGVARTLLKADGRRHREERELAEELARPPHDAQSVESEGSGRTAVVMAAALARLGPADREVLQLTTWEGLTPAELAVALGVRPGAARVRLHRARRALAADPAVRALVEEPEPAVRR